MSRHKLLTHYQLAQLTEKSLKNRSVSPITRKRIAARILDEIHNISDEIRANVLSCHEMNIDLTIQHGNAIRRQASKYLRKERI